MKALIIFLVLLPFDICAQAKIIIQGKVTEASTQESLVGGVVSVLKTNVFSITNEIGRYSLNLHKGTFKVLANYVGYNPDTIQIYLDKDTILNFSLQPITLSEVVVNGNRDNISDKIGTTSIPVLQLKSIPALLGEPDILRSLAMLPGVSNGVEGSVGLNVRGGSPEQNLILLDGATIYNAAHLFGFLSAFNTDAIKKVDLIKGGFPSQYGGRLSSVIDISFKDGNKERHSFEAGIGVLASKLLVEGPLKKNKVSYMIAARTSYLDLFTNKTRKNFNKNIEKKYTNYNFYDINAKLHFLVGKTGALSFSFYKGNDTYIFAEKNTDRTQSTINKLGWGNTVASMKYTQQINSKLLHNTQLSLNNYNYNYLIDIQPIGDSPEKLSLNYQSLTTINDINLKSYFKLVLNKKNNFTFGTDIVKQSFQPNLTRTKFDNIEIKDSSANTKIRKSTGISFFADYNRELLELLNLRMGVRQVNYKVDNVIFHFVEPRISLNYDFNKRNSLKFSYTKMNQMIHLLSNNTLGFNNDSWIPATKLAPPQSANQISLGYIIDFPKSKSYINIETYYKKMNNLIDYSEGSNPILDNSKFGWEQIIQKNGIGRAYGLEILLHKESGRFNGFLEYTISRTERKFAKINRNRWYPSRFDRIHDFGITGNYALSKKWSMSSNFVYSTGSSFTGPEFIYSNKPVSVQQNIPSLYFYYSGKNNLRLPDYLRLDLSATFTKRKKHFEHLFSFGTFNTFNRKNTISAYNYRHSIGYFNSNSIYIEEGVTAKYKERNLFGFIPYFTYNIKLNKS